MKLRRWQQKVIDEFPDIIKNYRKFILKAPTGAGKTVLASEIINRFYKNKKIVVLCHRLVLLEQLERGLSNEHKVKKLGLSETGKPFSGYDVLISTNLRSRDFLMKAIENCDLLIIDEAHRVSPNGQAYKELLDQFDNKSGEQSKLLGLTASPERRTGDQKDQLGLAFDAIIDCADIEELIKEKVLVPAEYKSFFIHDLETAVRQNLNVVAVVWLDGEYGLIKWKQQIQFSGEHSDLKFDNPDFGELAKSMNMWGTQVNSAKDFLPALKEAFKQKGPAIIGVPVDYSENMRLTEHLGKVSAVI